VWAHWDGEPAGTTTNRIWTCIRRTQGVLRFTTRCTRRLRRAGGRGKGCWRTLGWEVRGNQHFLDPPDWQYLRTYYFKTSFNLSRTACYSALYVDVIVNDGVVLYLNNVELMRANMPEGTPDNNTQALTDFPGLDWGYNYTTFAIPLTGSNVNYSLFEGPNYLAAEVHVNVEYGVGRRVGVRASAVLNTSCGAPKATKEVCDGVDNDNDGRVDVDTVTGSLLRRPCWTACGAGQETCIRGAYQNCSAPTVNQEKCNGIDDNCDGLVDNGIGQLDCTAGKVCFAGKCQPVQDLTRTQTVWQAKAPGWRYREDGVDMGGIPPGRMGLSLQTQPSGKAALGTSGFSQITVPGSSALPWFRTATATSGRATL